MGSNSEIVDISSGEEEENMNKSSEGSLGYLSGIMDEGFDDLIVMDELSTPPKKKKGLDGSKGFEGEEKEEEEEDDDDCVVLDSDPDKPASVTGRGNGGLDGSDELEIVGEKGQVACRDFPHPRHICANFPFSTTPHDQHCKMCHCYVCESPAPCEFWKNTSTNLSTMSHCNATDKDPFFKKMRDVKKNPSKASFLPSNPNLATSPISNVAPPAWRPVTHNTSNMPFPNPNPNPHLNHFRHPNPNPHINHFRHPNPHINPIRNPNPNPRVITQPSRMNVMRNCQTMHTNRASPYQQPIRSRHISRSNSMQTNRRPPGHPVLSSNPNPNPNPAHSNGILNRSHSTPETMIRMRPSQAYNNALRRTVSSQSGGSLQVPAHQIQNNNMQNNLADVDSKSWQDILASVATELGVPDYLSNSATLVPQPLQPVLGLSNQGINNGTGFGNNVSGVNVDLSLGEVNVSSQQGSVSASSPLYELQGNWGGSAPT